ncbi:TetR/AcrR family transcriptional regulator [Aestuariirhabdus sp. LZHN29]|uniref:TetR/AcrR family transcriptional regulator n=1 Tax=Aestuariirhabdus sp. LZHN29 TaxID=3417462 RepID=UPI003CE93FF5
MKKVSRKEREFLRREQEILDIALNLFLRKGEENVTVELIAEEVGIGKGTIYKHFRSKAEIYLRMMIDYERELADLFQSQEVTRDKDSLARSYFEYRLKDPEKYYLFERLEEKLAQRNPLPGMLDELHQIRASNFDRLADLIRARIAAGSLEDVPEYYHYCAAWALISGGVAMYHSPFWRGVIKDKEGFFDYMMDIGVRMGNRGRSRTSGTKGEVNAVDEGDNL